MEEEMKSMISKNECNLVDLSPGHKAIRNRWVLKIKCKVDVATERYKAWLVAKRYTQEEGIHYEKTFSPTVRFNSIHLNFGIVAKMD